MSRGVLSGLLHKFAFYYALVRSACNNFSSRISFCILLLGLYLVLYTSEDSKALSYSSVFPLVFVFFLLEAYPQRSLVALIVLGFCVLLFRFAEYLMLFSNLISMGREEGE
jgi:FtsH-binding integral membrane protein